ncbi:hypothetical protein SDC9_115340 [bioreactor metagenome]|uniref:Uncharacterized protein n=1 Tax=bioreactor metagenome TaxID=1076179 RepID=A0A645BTK6_9ZZZZ
MVHDALGVVPGPAGGEDDRGAVGRDRPDRRPQVVRHPGVVVDDGPVDVQGHQPRPPGLTHPPVSALLRQQRLAAEVGPQGHRHPDRPVGLLVVLQQHHDDPGHRTQRPVERRQRGGAVLEPAADVEPAGLEVGAVRGRGHLAVGLLRRQPGLAVELPGGGQAEVAGGDVDHPERDLQRLEELLLEAQQPVVLLLGVGRVAVDEHLDLVEPVHPEDAAGVLAVRPCLATVGRAVADVVLRQRLDDLVHVVAGQRHLGGADQVHVVALQPVDVLGRLTEEAGALHRGRLHQGRRDDRREAPVERLAHRQVDQCQLQLGALPGEVVEAGAGHLRAALHVDRPEDLTQLQVVARGEPLGFEVTRGADRLQHDEVVLAAHRHLRRDDVAQPAQPGGEGRIGLLAGRLVLLHLGGEHLGVLQQLLLLRPLGPADQLAEVLLLGAQRLEGRDGGPALLVQGEELIDDVRGLSAGLLRGSYTVGVLAQQLRIDHGVSLAVLPSTGTPRIVPCPLPSTAASGCGCPPRSC